MKIQTLPDGSLAIRESFRFLRIASVALACLAGIVLAGALASGSIEAGKAAWVALGIAALCLAGVVVDDRNFLFDAARKTLTWERSNLFRSDRGQVPFSDIRDVVVIAERSRDDDTTVGGYTVRYRAVLVTADGTNIPLSSQHSRNEREYRQLADRVLAVLAMPDKVSPKADEVERLVAAGRLIDAVSLIRARDGLDLAAAQAVVHRMRREREDP